MKKIALLILISSVFGSFARGAVVSIPPTSYGPRVKSGGAAIVPSGPIANTTIYTLHPSWIIDEGTLWPDGPTYEIWNAAASIAMSTSPLEVQVLMDEQTNMPKQLELGSLVGSFTSGLWMSNWQTEFLEMSPPINFFAFRIKASPSSYYYGYEVLEFNQYDPTEEIPVSTFGTKGLGLVQTTSNQPLLVTTPEPSVLTMTFFALGTLLIRRKR